MPPSREYRRGQLAALRKVRKWLHECWERNVRFQVGFPTAPKWQLLASKYGALTQEGHIQGLDRMIKRVKSREKTRRKV